MKQWGSWRGVTAAVFALGLSHSFAQQWKAELPAVEKAGVYRIVLSPEMVGRSQAILGDLRIMNEEGQEVPWLVEFGDHDTFSDTLIDFEVLRNESGPRRTIVDFVPPSPDFITEVIHLQFKNAIVTKELDLRGSYDGEHWYFIKGERLDLTGDPESTYTMRILYAPKNDYGYYRLAINDSLSAPLKVLSVKWKKATRNRSAGMQGVSMPWTRTDSAGRTWLRVQSPYMIAMDGLDIVVEDRRYQRQCYIEVPLKRSTRMPLELPQGRVESFTIGSNQAWSPAFRALRMDTFNIVIHNGDDQPLKIARLEYRQRKRTLIAELQSGMRYALTTGDTKRSSPHYDLIHFKDKLPEPIATIEHGPLIALAATPEAGPSLAPSRWWIWAGLVAVLGIVGFMAVRMLREPQQPNG
ncbi:MAG: hypothetical protein IPI55_07855 [Flavobacteriales bacterium]|nr:hypothetical protein [Flavobacteriales bacterium]